MRYLITLLIILFYSSSYSQVVEDHDFNDGTFGGMSAGSYWSIQNSGGVDNSKHARLTYSTYGNLGKALRIIPPQNSTSNTLWVEANVRAVGPVSGGSKFIKVFGKNASGISTQVNNMTLMMEYSNNLQSRVYYWHDNDCISIYTGTSRGGKEDCFVPTHVVTGDSINILGSTWHHYKAKIKRADSGQSNGEIKVWFNGVLRAHVIGMRSNPTSQGISHYFSSLEFGGYNHEANYSGATWYLDVDNVYVGTTEKGTESGTTHTLTVSKNGTGTGTVASSPSGITCGSTCSANYDENSNVTLSFLSDPGSTISSVSGCTLSGNQCTVNMGTSAKSVVATFNTATVTAEFNWSSPTYSVNEADGNTIVGRINRTIDTSGTASVYWQTLGITAVDKLDYTGIYPTLVEFADGETFKDVYLTILQDLEVEETETTELRLSSPVNGILGSNYSAILSIVDDDTEAVPVGNNWIPYNSGYVFSWSPTNNNSLPYTLPFILE